MDVTIEIKIAKDGRQSYRAALQKNIEAQQISLADTSNLMGTLSILQELQRKVPY